MNCKKICKKCNDIIENDDFVEDVNNDILCMRCSMGKLSPSGRERIWEAIGKRLDELVKIEEQKKQNEA